MFRGDATETASDQRARRPRASIARRFDGMSTLEAPTQYIDVGRHCRASQELSAVSARADASRRGTRRCCCGRRTSPVGIRSWKDRLHEQRRGTRRRGAVICVSPINRLKIVVHSCHVSIDTKESKEHKTLKDCCL